MDLPYLNDLNELHEFFFEIKKNLKEQWVEQLYHEFHHFNHQFSLKLRVPLIQLTESESVWGDWHSGMRRIRISEALIRKYPWETVLQVLKHEMAHMVADEIFRSHDIHGEGFARACGLLSVPKAFRKSNLDHADLSALDWRVSKSSEGEDSAVLRKVEKLLALANSGHENEAKLAMLRVHELMCKYNIERSMIQKSEDDFVTWVYSPGKQRLDRTYTKISSLLNGFYFVRCIFSTQFSASDGKKYATIRVLGRRQNVLMAEFVANFLSQQCDSLWKNYQKTAKVPGKLRLSFQLGILSGFQRSLESLEKKNPQFHVQEHGLMKRNDLALNSYVQSEFPRLRTQSATGLAMHKDAYTDGQTQGLKLNLNKPISKTGHSPVLLLG